MDIEINVNHLSKEFLIRKRKSGFLGSLAGLFYAEKETIRAVDDVAFQIRKGELVGYLGPNGAGKSTTIKMLTGILRPTSGELTVCGIDPRHARRKLAKKIGVVFGQKTQLWWDLPVRETFDLLRLIYKIPKDVYKKRMEFFNDLLHVNDFLDQQTRKLSLGQRMRTDLIASLLHNPEVLFLDEPTIGLDIITRDSVRRFIKELNSSQKTTILLTTHDMGDIEYLANRLILLDKGKIQYDGKIEDFTEKYSMERLLKIYLETPCDSSLFVTNGYRVAAQDSDMYYEILLPNNESMSPLIESINQAGVRIKEISAEKQDLSDTLKQIYKGRKLEL